VSTSATTGGERASLSDKQRRILAHLRDNADDQTYFKSRLIGDALGMTPREVGANMTAIQEGEFEVDVEKWGYSSSTTWKVTA
jgi:hypothetical protein